MALLTVTLNAAVDKTYTVPGFAVDRVQRPAETRVFAGGKGINVARVTRTLGGEVLATGFLGGRSGQQIAQCLDAEGIAHDFVTVEQESRVCSIILDPEGGTETILNEVGPSVTAGECRALLDRLRELLPGCQAVVFSGSLPPGVPPSFYADVIRLAQDAFGVPAVLDTSGDALRFGVGAKPFLVKPNVQELEALSVGGDGWGGSASALRRQGVDLALITSGKRGAVVASADGLWEAVPPPLTALSAIGSGDSLTAGFVWAWGQGRGCAEALKLGVAAGAANALVYGSGFCTREQILAIAARVTVNKLH